MQYNNAKFKTLNIHALSTVVSGAMVLSCLFLIHFFNISVLQIMSVSTVSAQEVPTEYSDPTNSKFRIVICDGPRPPSGITVKDDYIACDFNGLMLQVRHIINLMMVLGVFSSILAFSWAGWLYISGNPENKKRAHAIFPKIFTGFIIMLSSWFIVYQILSWLVDNDSLKTLLGNP